MLSVTASQDERGRRVPGIPPPSRGLRRRCACGRKFWTGDGYRGHYALCHILAPPPGEELAAPGVWAV